MRNLRDELNIELPRAKGAYLEDAPDKIWTEKGWVLEPKEDGTRESLQIGMKNSLMVGRNREDFLKGVEKAGSFMVHDHPVFSKIACSGWEGTILDGECTMHFTQDGEYDETTKVRIREGKFVGYTVWGALFVKGTDVRDTSEEYRRIMAEIFLKYLEHPNIRLIDRFPATREKLEEIQASGEEGAVAKWIYGTLPKNQRTCPTWWKLKTQDTVDAFITDVTEGKSGGSGVAGIKPQQNRTAASFTVSMFQPYCGGLARGMKIVPVAKVKHLPDEIQSDGFLNFAQYKGRVIEMKVSGWNGKAFRWARFIRFRDDKSATECKFSEQIGKNI